ncbi:MAG: hypothetical protein ACJ756_14125 [Solirubrobacterales bacterium]
MQPACGRLAQARRSAGDEPTIVGGPPLAPPGRLELVWILEADGALFLRYRVPRP